MASYFKKIYTSFINAKKVRYQNLREREREKAVRQEGKEGERKGGK